MVHLRLISLAKLYELPCLTHFNLTISHFASLIYYVHSPIKAIVPHRTMKEAKLDDRNT